MRRCGNVGQRPPPQYLDISTKPFVGSLKKGISAGEENQTHPLLAIVLLVFLVLLGLRAGGDNIAVRPEVVSVEL